jgi:hypothetical protein
MPFLTELDSRAEIRGSRDPLGTVPIWSHFGRKVVGNLTTVSSTVRGFTTLLVGLYLAEQIHDADPDSSLLETFLKFEALGGYARVRRDPADRSVRGILRVRSRLNGTKRIRISASTTDQILSNQKVYGLWGLYSQPARASELLEAQEQRLSPAARRFVEKQHGDLLSRRNPSGRLLLDLLRREAFDLDPEGRHTELLDTLGRAHDRRLRTSERPFYEAHLCRGGDIDTTSGRQPELFELLREISGREFGWPEFNVVRSGAEKRGSAALRQHLADIESMERLLVPSGMLFSFLLTQEGRTVEEIAAGVRKSWTRGLAIHPAAIERLTPDIAAAVRSDENASRWVAMSYALSTKDYAEAIRTLLQLNASVMQSRNGSAAWIALESDRLRIRMSDDADSLPSPDEVLGRWKSTYFINSLWSITREVA